MHAPPLKALRRMERHGYEMLHIDEGRRQDQRGDLQLRRIYRMHRDDPALRVLRQIGAEKADRSRRHELPRDRHKQHCVLRQRKAQGIPRCQRLCEKEGTEYAYLLDDDGRWYYYRAGDETVRDLETDLRLAYPEGFRSDILRKIGGGTTPKMFQRTSTHSDPAWLFFF